MRQRLHEIHIQRAKATGPGDMKRVTAQALPFHKDFPVKHTT